MLLDSSVDHYMSAVMTQRTYQGRANEIASEMQFGTNVRTVLKDHAKLEADEPEGGWDPSRSLPLES